WTESLQDAKDWMREVAETAPDLRGPQNLKRLADCVDRKKRSANEPRTDGGSRAGRRR
ncbi:unnamed protein product, partial [Ectocarpus sp. 8 AP-2014]